MTTYIVRIVVDDTDPRRARAKAKRQLLVEGNEVVK